MCETSLLKKKERKKNEQKKIKNYVLVYTFKALSICAFMFALGLGQIVRERGEFVWIIINILKFYILFDFLLCFYSSKSMNWDESQIPF